MSGVRSHKRYGIITAPLVLVGSQSCFLAFDPVHTYADVLLVVLCPHPPMLHAVSRVVSHMCSLTLTLAPLLSSLLPLGRRAVPSSLSSLAAPHSLRSRSQQEILSFLDQDITDLCVSRTTFDWGIPVPDAPGHVMYVWFDALSNYLSGIGYLEDDAPNADMWPADVHIIGKDITRFHCIYWPCMLMAANIPLPKVVFGHGFVHDSKGKKMSKSVGNVVDPNKILDIYSSDVFRFFLTRQCHYGSDLSCDLGAMVALCESELNDALGNLVNRAVKLSEKYCDNWYDYSTSFPALRWLARYHPSSMYSSTIYSYPGTVSIHLL